MANISQVCPFFGNWGGHPICAHSRCSAQPVPTYGMLVHTCNAQQPCHRGCAGVRGGSPPNVEPVEKDLERFDHTPTHGDLGDFKGGPTRTALLGLPAQASDEARDQREQAHRHREQLNECAQAIRALTSLASCAQARRGSWLSARVLHGRSTTVPRLRDRRARPPTATSSN